MNDKQHENLNLIIDFYLQKKREGCDYADIRKELDQKNMDKETIRFIINMIDSQFVRESCDKGKKRKLKESIVIGYVLLLAGGFLLIATYFAIIDLHGRFLIPFVPIILGYLIILRTKGKITPRQNIFRREE